MEGGTRAGSGAVCERNARGSIIVAGAFPALSWPGVEVQQGSVGVPGRNEFVSSLFAAVGVAPGSAVTVLNPALAPSPSRWGPLTRWRTLSTATGSRRASCLRCGGVCTGRSPERRLARLHPEPIVRLHPRADHRTRPGCAARPPPLAPELGHRRDTGVSGTWTRCSPYDWTQ